MMNAFKLFLAMFLVTGMLTACGSKNEKEPDPIEDPVMEEPMEEPVYEEEFYEEEVIELPTVFYFDFDQSILSAEARAALLGHAERLISSPESVRLEGHADERGSREYNMALGERRANAVRDFLILQGVDSSLLETVSYGEEQPSAIGSYDSAWAENRRVELR